MIELPLVFIGGLLGSSHCIGMCGGFAVLLGISQTGWRTNLAAQLTYSAGRIFTYCFLGAAAGSLGAMFGDRAGSWMNVPAVLCVLAGLFLVVEGLAAAGFEVRRWRRQKTETGAIGCTTLPLFAALLKTRGLQSAFSAGMLTGFIPCGLVYAFISLAASAGGFAAGILIMGLFGLGTIPLMVITGVGGSLLSIMQRQRIVKIAAWCVVLTGLVTVARGAGFVRLPSVNETIGCPFCADADVSAQADRRP